MEKTDDSNFLDNNASQILFLMSLLTLDRAGFTPSGGLADCPLSLKAVIVSGASKLSKYVPPLLDVHAETGRMSPQDRDHGAWVPPAAPALTIAECCRTASQTRRPMRRWAPSPSFVLSGAFEWEKVVAPSAFYC